MDEEGFARGNADELFRFRDEVADFDPEVVLVMSADHVYRLDYNDVLDTHREREAECTVVVVQSPEGDDPGDHGVVEVDEEGRSPASTTNPTSRATDTIVTEVIAYDPTVLREVLEELHRDLAAGSDEGDTGLGDFGDHLLPALIERGRTSPTVTRATGATSASRITTCAPTARCSPTTSRCCRCPVADPVAAAPEGPGTSARRRSGRGQPALARQPGGRRRTPQRAGAGRGGRVGRRGP